MGCAPSKHEFGRKSKGSRKQEVDIGWPTDFRRNSASYPATLCVECDLPSRTLLASLGNLDEKKCCTCDDAAFDLDYDLKPISPMSPISLFTQRELPTRYNFDFGFKEDITGFEERYTQGYFDDCDDEEAEAYDQCHKRYASFSSDQWKVDHNVVVTSQEIPPSRTNSFASSDCLGPMHSNSERVPILNGSTLDNESFGPKLRIMGKLPFDTFNHSSPDLLSASARKSHRVPKEQVKVVRILGSRTSSNLL